MTAFAAISLNDGQAVPVAHSFGPVSLANTDAGSIAEYADRVLGIPIGYPVLKISVRKPTGTISAGSASDANKRVFRVKISIWRPTMESTSASTGTGIAPAPTVAYVHSSTHEFVLPERGALADRKDILAFAVNALADATVVAAVHTLEAVY